MKAVRYACMQNLLSFKIMYYVPEVLILDLFMELLTCIP